MALTVKSGQEAVSIAKQWLGTPYCWGGGHSGPVKIGTCVDCSGLVNQVYGTTGNTFVQVQMGSSIGNIANAQPGDLVFFGPIAPGEPHHVGIYTGGNTMIDAPFTGTVVRTDSVNGFGPIYAIRRLVPPTPNADQSGQTGAGGITFTYAQLEAVWIQAGGSAQTAPMAAAIAMAESGGVSNALGSNVDGSWDRGLWQINSVHGPSQSTNDVMGNARAAVSISNNGQNWRPWCTAYSDASCGKHGGTYLGQGAPYQKYLNTSVQPDYSAPINATNAAADNAQGTTNQGNTQSQQNENLCDALFITFLCDILPGGGSVSGILLQVIGMVLNPLIAIFGGILGVGAGGILMLFGIYSMVQQSSAGKTLTGTALTAAGLATGQPELIGAGIGGIRGAGRQRLQTIRGQQVAARATQRSQEIGQRQIGVSQAQTAGRIAVKGTESSSERVAQQRTKAAGIKGRAQTRVARLKLQQETVKQENLTLRTRLNNKAASYPRRKAS